MRYARHGAAGFIGSHLAESARARRPRGRRHRLLHRLLRPGAEGGERPRARRAPARPGRGRARLRRLRRRLPPRRPAGRAQLRGRLPALPAPQRARLAARLRGGRARRRPGRLRVVVVGLRRGRALPDARRTRRRGRSRRTGSRSSPASSSPRRTRASSASTASCCATSTPSARGSGPTWRSRASRSRSPPARAFELYGDGDQSRGWTYVCGRRRRDDRRRWRGGSGTYNVGGAIEASMNEAIELLERISGPPARRAPRAPSVPGDQRRTSADTTRIRGRARLAAARVARGRAPRPVGMGLD